MTAAHALHYAGPKTHRPPGRRSRLAVAAAVVCVASPVLSFALLSAHVSRVVPHLLCCRHPEIAVPAFVAFPVAASVLGVVAVIRVARSRGTLRGWIPAGVAGVLGAALACVGWVLVHLSRM